MQIIDKHLLNRKNVPENRIKLLSKYAKASDYMLSNEDENQELKDDMEARPFVLQSTKWN